MKHTLILFAALLLISACKDNDTKDDPITPAPQPTEVYFPPKTGTWETTSPESLGWNLDSINALYADLQLNDTRAFIVLKNGKIVLEKYWGKDILNLTDFDATKKWYWASAGKTLTGFAIGKAAEQGHLTLQDKTSKHLGEGWTSLSKVQEDKITVWHQLTMTSGLDDTKSSGEGFAPENLVYKADAGTRWAYHNAPYTLLDQVVTNATGIDFDAYFKSVLEDKIGMDGLWQWSGNNHVYFSTARSAARFGILIQNNGVWDGVRLINKAYIDASITKSQDINNAYGYLWWLNGTTSFRLPQSQTDFPGMILTDAPKDVYSALGKNGQYVSISPSNGLVIIRMGNSPDSALVPFLYLNDVWNMLSGVMK